MDTEPFLSVSLVKDDPDTIKPFSKGFDLAKIREDAEFHRNRDALVQSSAETISEWLAQQMREPADSFVNYVRVNLIKDIHRDTLSEALKQGSCPVYGVR